MLRRFCPQCDWWFDCQSSRANRADRLGAPLYCGKVCAGLARRVEKASEAERKEAKRQYDAARRVAKHEELCAKKRAHYYANRDRIAAEQAVYRAKHMQRHVAYCRQPAYREKKSAYDSTRRATLQFGQFADAFLVLLDLEREISERATRYEIYQANGTLNKTQNRKRALA